MQLIPHLLILATLHAAAEGPSLEPHPDSTEQPIPLTIQRSQTTEDGEVMWSGSKR